MSSILISRREITKPPRTHPSRPFNCMLLLFMDLLAALLDDGADVEADDKLDMLLLDATEDVVAGLLPATLPALRVACLVASRRNVLAKRAPTVMLVDGSKCFACLLLLSCCCVNHVPAIILCEEPNFAKCERLNRSGSHCSIGRRTTLGKSFSRSKHLPP